MQKTSLSLNISPTVGKVSAEYIIAENPTYIMTLAHGAGANMNHSWMVSIADALAESGITTLRFNFPFMESKKGRPDLPAVAHATIQAAITQARLDYPALPMFVGGKSFGGRMSSQHLALRADDLVKGIVFYGFPLHPPKKPSIERAEHLKAVTVPMLFLQGTRDELATPDLITSVCSSLALAKLFTIEGADHAFKAGKKDLVPILVKETKDWMDNILQ